MPKSSQSSLMLTRLPFYYGWVVVTIAFISMGIGVNTRTAFSLLYPPILEEFGWERGVTAAAFSLGFMASALYSPAIGWLMDRLGPRYVIALGSLLVAVGIILTTYINEPWHLYLTLGVLVVGGSISLSYIGHGAFLPNWFVRRRGLAIGVAFAGVGFGAIVLFPWLQTLIDTVGWREACWTMAILLMVLLIPLNLLFQRQKPEELGLLPDGDRESPEHPRSATPENVVNQQWANTEWTLLQAMMTMRFWWIGIGYFTSLFAWYGIQVHQTKYLIDIGFSTTESATALGLVALFGVIGQITIGYLSDQLGREWGWMMGCLGFALSSALLMYLKYHPSPIFLYLMIASQGLLGYGIAPVYASVAAEIFQGKHYGTIFGTLSASAALGSAAGPWVTGVMYDHWGDYELAFLLSLVLCLVSIVTIWLAAPRKIRVVSGQIAHLQANR